MELRKLVYPAPLASYTVLDPDLIWIPRTLPNNPVYKILHKLKLISSK